MGNLFLWVASSRIDAAVARGEGFAQTDHRRLGVDQESVADARHPRACRCHCGGGMTREISGLGARGWPRVDKDCTPLALHQVRSRGGQRRACALALPGLRRPLGDPPLALGRREALGVFSHGLATADVFSPEPDGPHPRARRQVADALGWVGVNLQAALDGHLGTER